MEHCDRQDENLKRPSVNLQRLEEYFEYLYSSGERVIEQGCRRFDDGTTLPERRRDYSERSDYSNIGKEMLHGFIDRVRKELRDAMGKGETSVSIRVSLPNISNVYPCGVILFMDDISDYLEPEEGIKVSYNKIGAENSDGSRDLIITFEREEIDDLSASQDASENLKDITATEQYFEYLERDEGRRRKAKNNNMNVNGQSVEDQSVQERRSPREGKEAMQGFVERIKKEILQAMEKGFDTIKIRVDLESITELSEDFQQKFMDRLFKEININGRNFEIWDMKIGTNSRNELILLIEFSDIKKLKQNRKLNTALRRKVSIIRSKIGLALMFTGALTVGIGGAAYYHQGSKKSNTEAMVELEPKLTTTAEQTAEPESIIPQFKTIYCEISREQKGYTPACRASGKPKIIVLEDTDKTDNLVPVEIKVPMDGIDFACKAVIEKTPPNEDGSSKIIMQGDLECTSSD